MLKNKRRILTRIFCFIGAVLVFSASFVFASDITPDDVSGYRYFTMWNGKARFTLVSGNEEFIMYDELPFELFSKPSVGHIYSTTSTNDGFYVDEGFRYMAGRADGEYITSLDVPYPRHRLGYVVMGEADMLFKQVRYDFNPITFKFHRNFFSSFYVVGNGSVRCSGTLTWKDSSNRVHTYSFSYGRTISGSGLDNVAAPLAASAVATIQSESGIADGQMCTINLRVDWTPVQPMGSAYLSIPVTSMLTTSATAYPIGMGYDVMFQGFDWKSAYEYWYNVGSTPSPVAPGAPEFTQWLASTVSSVFDVELFWDVSISDICFSVLGIGMVFWLLKMYAGG